MPPPGTWPTGPADPWASTGPAVAYASFWARLGARVIDTLIVMVPFAVIFGILVSALPKTDRYCTVNGELSICRGPTGASIAVLALVGIIGFVAVLAYFIMRVGGSGATIGQKMLGIRVVDESSGQVIGYGRATGRYFMSFVSGWLCYLGYLWMLWDARRQTWHDKVVRAIVVKG